MRFSIIIKYHFTHPKIREVQIAKISASKHFWWEVMYFFICHNFIYRAKKMGFLLMLLQYILSREYNTLRMKDFLSEIYKTTPYNFVPGDYHLLSVFKSNRQTQHDSKMYLFSKDKQTLWPISLMKNCSCTQPDITRQISALVFFLVWNITC